MAIESEDKRNDGVTRAVLLPFRRPLMLGQPDPRSLALESGLSVCLSSTRHPTRVAWEKSCLLYTSDAADDM
eukprot:9126273-Alexandrium_andersonii.AAC.1